MGELSHGDLLLIFIGVLAIVAGGVGWYVKISSDRTSAYSEMIDKILREDHVHRAEFEAHRLMVSNISNNLATVQAIQKEVRRRLDVIETKLDIIGTSHIRDK